MELKEYVQIINKQKFFFVSVIVIIVLLVQGYFNLRPISYSTSLLLNVTRMGTQETQDFRYDDFYRLQADEKFTETLVEWLKSPRIVLDIFNEAKIDSKSMSLRSLSKAVRPAKMSSQVVLVSFSSPDKETANKISQAVVKTVSGKTQELNKDQKNDTWFEIIASEPVVVKNEADLFLAFWISLAFGIFLSFWAVMIRHYLK